jgi:hypothetical protein
VQGAGVRRRERQDIVIPFSVVGFQFSAKNPLIIKVNHRQNHAVMMARTFFCQFDQAGQVLISRPGCAKFIE